MRLIFIFLIGFMLVNGATLKEIKKLKYAEQTPQNVDKYKSILQTLVKQGNVKAMIMLAQAYESGSHWDANATLANEYYIKASNKGNLTAHMKLGKYYYNISDFEKSKIYFEKAFKVDEKGALEYLLLLSVESNNHDNITTYLDSIKKHSINIDSDILKEAKDALKNVNSLAKKITDKMIEKTSNAAKTYVIGMLKTISSLEGAYKNLGFEVEAYIIHNGVEPTVEIILEKVEYKNIDEEMALYIAGGNILKKSIINSMIWANDMDAQLRKEVNQELIGLEIEVGTTAIAKIVTKEIESD